MLPGLRLLEKHWGTHCPVHTWAGPSGPAAPHRAYGCPRPASSLADTPGRPPAWHRACGRGGVWESWTPDSPRPKVTRSAGAAEPWQGPSPRSEAAVGGMARLGCSRPPALGTLLSLSFVLPPAPSQKMQVTGEGLGAAWESQDIGVGTKPRAQSRGRRVHIAHKRCHPHRPRTTQNQRASGTHFSQRVPGGIPMLTLRRSLSQEPERTAWKP